MPHGVAAAAFQQVHKAEHIALHIGAWVFQRIAHPGLPREVDDHVEAVGLEQRFQPVLIFEVHFHEAEAFVLFTRHFHAVGRFPAHAEFCQTGLLELRGIIVVQLVESDDVVPLFLKADVADGGLGLTEQQIGLYYGTFGAAAFVLGSILAGYYIARLGLRKALFSLVCIFNLPFLIYTYFAWTQPSSALFIGAGIVVEYFGYGFGFVGLTLFMMQQVAPGKHQMAHYAFASGIMNLSVMMTGAVSGFLSDAVGYRMFFVIVMAAVVPVFIMCRFLPFTHPDKAEAPAGEDSPSGKQE